MWIFRWLARDNAGSSNRNSDGSSFFYVGQVLASRLGAGLIPLKFDMSFGWCLVVQGENCRDATRPR